MFKGLSAFPLTPFSSGQFDEKSYLRIIKRLTDAKVELLGILGSTGSYAYLTRNQRKHIAETAITAANNIPAMVCIGAISTTEVLHLAEDAQKAGAGALLLPPMSYQALSNDEVFGLYETVSKHISIPLCIYDNPSTTHFTFSDELYAKIAELPHIASIKISGLSNDITMTKTRIQKLRDKLPSHITIGISGDAFAVTGLIAGCDAWYSVCGGLFPHISKAVMQATSHENTAELKELNDRLEPFWALFRKHGSSLRVMAAAANILGLTDKDCLPRPLLPLSDDDYVEVSSFISTLQLDNFSAFK